MIQLNKPSKVKRIEKLECKPHTQIVHFIGGYKRTIFNVKYVWENEMVHIIDGKGIEWVINKDNVLCIEKISVDKDK